MKYLKATVSFLTTIMMCSTLTGSAYAETRISTDVTAKIFLID